jgi:glutaredoxin
VPRVKSIHLVYAEWCPHCVPNTMERMKKAAAELGAEFQAHDIDTSDVQVADELVKKYGDWSPDYLVPQAFLEFDDGSFKHVLTGDPRGVAFTQRLLDGFLSSKLYIDLKARKED